MRIAILGAGESGVGAAILAQQKGFEVFVSDKGHIAEQYKNMLNQYGLQWEEGHHTEERILNADEIIKSPGIPDTAPIVAKAIAKAIPIISEIEFAGRYTQARKICITGSNGKTTTTSLIYHILKKAGFDVGLAGNIGRSMALQVAQNDREWYVIELSSFQLDNMYDFRADIAVLLNITPDHLDRYNYCMQNYVESKMRIIRNQRQSDAFIFWEGDEYISKELKKHDETGEIYSFSDEKSPASIAFVEDGVMRLLAPFNFEMQLQELSLRGRHNVRNAMAAALATLRAGVAPEAVRSGLSDFPGVEHRLQNAGTAHGIHFINDSKATNVDACYYALDAMHAPVVLILGGLDKGNDYNEIMPLVKEKCRALVFLGVDNRKLKKFFGEKGIFYAETGSMDECMKACVRLAHPGDTVLLSPCCASFDLFRNMEDRGEQFMEWVKRFAHEGKEVEGK